MSKQFLDFIVCISRMRCLLCYSMKGLVIRLINTSKLNENEKENLEKERKMTLIDDGKLIESEFGVTRRKKYLRRNIILFCSCR